MSTPGPGREGHDGPVLVNRCPAVALLPPPADVVRAATAPARPALRLRCELAEHHPDEHADLLWDDDRLGGALWVRWTDSRMYRVVLFWCTHTDELGDACGLFADHPPGHSWEIIDTTEEASPELPPQRGVPDSGDEPPSDQEPPP